MALRSYDLIVIGTGAAAFAVTSTCRGAGWTVPARAESDGSLILQVEIGTRTIQVRIDCDDVAPLVDRLQRVNKRARAPVS